MAFEVDLPGTPAWDPAPASELAAAAGEALRVLEEQWHVLDQEYWNCYWFGPEHQVFNDRYQLLKGQVERLREELRVVPARVTQAGEEAHEARRRQAYGFGLGTGLVWDVLDRVAG